MPPMVITDVQAKILPQLTDTTFSVLRDFIYERTGIHFLDHKKYLLEGRLCKRLQVLNMSSFEDYFRFLKYDRRADAEMKFLYDVITIKETSFFRNPPQLNAFENTIFPALYKAAVSNGRSSLRIWSAGSSTGEEAYTLAMIYLEKLRPQFPLLEIEIIATDISRYAIDMSQKGIYREYTVRNMPAMYNKKYMIQDDTQFYVRDEVKRLVKFECLNLYNAQQMRQMKNFDVIFCCNVLIYFDAKSKMQVVSDFYNSLNHGGYLFIGYAETLHGISGAYKVMNLPRTITYMKE